ncbi:MAG: hypothetical protein LBF94_00125 [Puniceicoccales bacterium]|jgi:hypothetical protein|nr:hypothetical protein [Puniceicoccales bacterium]
MDDLIQLFSSNGLQVSDLRGRICLSIGKQNDVEAGEFCGRLIRPVWEICLGELEAPRYCNRTLEARVVLAKRPISSSVCIASDVSQLQKSLERVFTRLCDEAGVAGSTLLREYERNFRHIFAPIFISRGESAEDLNKIREAIRHLLAQAFDGRNAKRIYSQCNRVLEHSGAMTVFGILRSALSTVQRNERNLRPLRT